MSQDTTVERSGDSLMALAEGCGLREEKDELYRQASIAFRNAGQRTRSPKPKERQAD